MNRFFPLPLLWCLLFCQSLWAQIHYTANDTVPPYGGNFHYGANLGAYYFWTDQQLADIAAGNPALGVEGVGVTSLRVLLSEKFLDYWGYDIRLDAFRHYDYLGITDNVVFVGYPAPQHQDTTHYCPAGPSELFANLYTPIWDNGENGTPVNDSNYYALYLYRMVSLYGPFVKYWEIWNEPDFDFVGNSSRQPGEPGNWWEYDPDPCHFALHAPIQHYVRLLRISYEVIKSIAPDDYVAIGGIGYPSFLDLVLRNTDNPDGGSIDSLHPLPGGAYFDVLSYHSYPHIDNSMRAWSNDIGGFVYFRHSDRAVDGLLNLQTQLRAVLEKHGYDGSVFPEKNWIITETNIPRAEYGEYLGTPEAQQNFLIKSAVACQMNGIDQLHVYQLGDIESERDARSEFHLMGLYHELDSVPQYRQQRTTGGIAWATVSELLREHRFDAERTAQLQLPADIRGGAFEDGQGKFTYVLWAATSLDRSEEASTNYTFPVSFQVQALHQRQWDFSSRRITTLVDASKVELGGSPVFLRDSEDEVPPESPGRIVLDCHPNPFGEQLRLQLHLPDPMVSSLSLYDMQGRLVVRFFTDLKLAEGEHSLRFDGRAIPAGMYLLHFGTAGGRSVDCRVVRG